MPARRRCSRSTPAAARCSTVEHALAVPPEALADSRRVLARFGNMSSATILFVLADMMARGASGEGIAIAFGPGLAAEAIRFTA